MNRIFVRIYMGMLVALLVIGLFTYGTLVLTNLVRADNYRESMSKGTFYLLSMGIADHKGLQRDQWMTLMEKVMGVDLQLYEGKELDLGQRELNKLASGLPVFEVRDDDIAEVYSKVHGEQLYLHAEIEKVSEQHARATAFMILTELAKFSPEKWDMRLAEIQNHFGFPLAKVARNTVKLDQEQVQKINRKEIVFVLNENTAGRASSLTIYAPMGASGSLLRLGPLYLFERLPFGLSILLGIFSLSAMGFAAYILVRPLETRLSKMSFAVKKIGGGDFSARTEVGEADAVGELAGTVNGMAEHIQRLVNSQKEMTRAVSHELRTPVARIRFGLEMLAAKYNVPDDVMNEIDRDIEELDQLIDEILTFAQMEEDAPRLNIEKINILELLQQVRKEQLPLSGDISIVIAEPVPAQQVEADRHYLHRAVQNLVGNARRYASSEIIMSFSVEEGLAIITIDDDGPGIPEDERERVFDLFSRLDTSRNKESGGYGLGLSIVRRIVDWHAGSVCAAQSETGGARFVMSWPCNKTSQLQVLQTKIN